ncbi:hypothetical protein ACEQ8H_004181 [Pleosporales sp. CAS-2024a]
MSHCHDEHHDHGHEGGGHEHHDHGHEGGGHDHSDDMTPALQHLLYEQIDFGKLLALNEAESNSGRAICQKTWAQRLSPAPELASAADEQLLLMVPFTGQVRLHAILVRTSATPAAPKTLKVYLNADNLDFDTAADTHPTQTLHLAQTNDVQEIPVKRALFNTTRSLALFFEDNWSGGDDDVTRLTYLAFKGDFMRLNTEPVSVLYEAAANPADHKSMVGVGEGVGSIQ